MAEIVKLEPGLGPRQDITRYCAPLRAHLQEVLSAASRAERRIRGARTLAKALEYYARFLADYHMNTGGRGIHLRMMDQSARRGPYERRQSVFEWRIRQVTLIRNQLRAIDDEIDGVHPWLSVPNMEGTKWNMVRILAAVSVALNTAINLARELESYPSTVEGRAA